MMRQRLNERTAQTNPGYTAGPTGSPPGTVPTMSGRTATAEEQQAFTNRNIARAEYGSPWRGGGFPQYAGGIKDRMMEAEKQKALLELRRNALKDKQSAEKHQLEIAKSAREQEKHELEKSGQWGAFAGGEGKDTTLQTSGNPLTKGVPDKMKTLPPAGATPNPQTLPSQGEAVQAVPLGQIPTQTAPSPFPPETGSFNTPGGRIVVPEESAKNDPMLKAGTWLMNEKGNARRIYGQPKPSLGDDPFAYTPNVPRPTLDKVTAIPTAVSTTTTPVSEKGEKVVGQRKKREGLTQSIMEGGSDIGTHIGSGLAKGTIWGDIGSLARRALAKLSPFTLYEGN